MKPSFTRKAAVITGAAVAALAVFGGGIALGYAVSGSDSAPADDNSTVSPGWSPYPGPSQGENRPPDIRIGFPQLGSSRDGDFGGSGLYGVEDSLTYPAFDRCSAPVGNILTANGIDLAGSGFAMNLLDSGYVLTGVSLRSEGPCDDEGHAASGSLVLDTSWIHAETGLDVWVSQRASDEPVANVMYNEGASFWADGYEYSAWVSTRWYYPMPADGPEPADAPAPDIGRYPGPEPDPRIPGVVAQVVGHLAPSIGEQCFYRQQQGGWEDLADMGLSDPRGAIPSGFTENYLEVRSFAPPADGCAGADLGFEVSQSFSAGFTDGSDGWLDISAWRSVGEALTYPGWSDPWSVSWASNGWQISISGSRGGSGLGSDVLMGIGRALGVDIDEACFIEERELAAGELEALGFRQPVSPDGYTLRGSSLRATEVPEGCEGADSAGLPAYSLSWTFAGPDVNIEANVHRSTYVESPDAPESRGGYISDWGMHWADADGDMYSIWVDDRGAGTVDRDAMIVIAESLDPTLDVSTLSEETGGGGSPGQPRPLPRPVED